MEQLMITDTLISNLERALREDPEARLATRHATFASLLEVGDESLLIKSREGAVTFVKDPTTDEPWDFAVRGSADAWKKFRQAPTPTTNHAFAMAYQGHMSLTGKTPSYFRFEGNYRKLFANMSPLCAILEQLRRVEA
jgi:hypothetical protein